MVVKGWKREFVGEYCYIGELDFNFVCFLFYSEKYFFEKVKIMVVIGLVYFNIVDCIEFEV